MAESILGKGGGVVSVEDQGGPVSLAAGAYTEITTSITDPTLAINDNGSVWLTMTSDPGGTFGINTQIQYYDNTAGAWVFSVLETESNVGIEFDWQIITVS